MLKPDGDGFVPPPDDGSDGGAAIVGGCCGTTPAHIKAFGEAIAGVGQPDGFEHAATGNHALIPFLTTHYRRS